MQTIDFWYEFASTYSYPAAMRISRLASEAKVPVRWRPFLLAPAFKKQGWEDSPFNIYPEKGRYMWRDFERVCGAEELPLRLPPAIFPQPALRATLVAIIGEREGWGSAFSRGVYKANFAYQMDISDDETLHDILESLGVDHEPVLEEAGSPETRAALRAQVNESLELGIFGAPTFMVGDEMFWGNDRLEDAIRWAAKEPAE